MQAPVLQPIQLVQLPGPVKKKNLLLFATDGGAMEAVPQLSELASGFAAHGALITSGCIWHVKATEGEHVLSEWAA